MEDAAASRASAGMCRRAAASSGVSLGCGAACCRRASRLAPDAVRLGCGSAAPYAGRPTPPLPATAAAAAAADVLVSPGGSGDAMRDTCSSCAASSSGTPLGGGVARPALAAAAGVPACGRAPPAAAAVCSRPAAAAPVAPSPGAPAGRSAAWDDQHWGWPTGGACSTGAAAPRTYHCIGSCRRVSGTAAGAAPLVTACVAKQP